MLTRLPLRVRLTVAFALVMALVLALTGVVVYRIFRGDLNSTIDRSLGSRSAEVAALVRQAGPGLGSSLPSVSGAGDDFAAVLTPAGVPLAATPQVQGRRLLSGSELDRAARSSLVLQHPPVERIDGTLRMRALPVATPAGRRIVVVGTSLGQRDDSLRTLALLLAAGGLVALVLASLAGYGVATGALRPVEAMRRRAAAISPSEVGQRLPVPDSGDEIARLGLTLNELLDRLEAASLRERRFTADASHELRTPLGILKAELELALRRGRSPEELRAALESAAEETERLVRLAEDLLVIARLDRGELPARREQIEVAQLLGTVAARFGPRLAAGVTLQVEGGEGLWVSGDELQLEQALGNLLENALRHGSGELSVTAARRGSGVELHVRDEGPGFAPDFIERAFERFARADGARSRGGAGLGLAIVAGVAESHGGRAVAVNRPGAGADVWLELPAATPPRTAVPEPVTLP